MKVAVGADVGGTKIDISVAALDGTPLAQVRRPAGDWEASPVDAAARRLVAELSAAVPAGHVIAAFGIGAQGCDTQEHCARLAAAVETLGGVPAVVVNDAALLVPAAGLDRGIGLIAGTGSIGVAADAEGRVLFAGGWGWVLGDEGSAPAIVREATRAALSAHDAGLGDDGLLSALLAHFGAADPPALARCVNDRPEPGAWGPGAPAVFHAADAGSALAARVVDEAAGGLQTLVAQLTARGAVGDTVVAAGSVVVHQPRLADGLRTRLAASHPSLTLRLLDVQPVAGGVVLARRRLGAG
ncbi:BadF/BadG/BcrA/BcrD ATPase family protein [Streptomyces sp. TS71-3]|uniref:BadF/BadG/BcrA/BcrD ATPase family protein n=1 Tax=Streptomyces sp. TS71-3 TaxID=2733862 RepID=UPI001B2259AF|nr:BadF/BadG/BcrA/BcrD ATPase family protein [Streptomyces sp. TS71-3]GHJ40974.1 ATPase [Streptomyces sp. TS71-3]